MRTSKQARNKQQASNNTSQKKIGSGSGSGSGPGLKLRGWPYPMVASPNPGFRLRAASPLRAAAAPTGGGTTPKRGRTGQTWPKTAPNCTQGTSVQVRDASWPIGGAGHAVKGPQHPAAPPPPPVWVRFGRNRAGWPSELMLSKNDPGPFLARFTGHIWAYLGPF